MSANKPSGFAMAPMICNRMSSMDVADQAQQMTLRDHVARLAVESGPRNLYHHRALQQTEAYIWNRFVAFGYTPHRQEYTARDKAFANLMATVPGRSRPDEIFVVGAHYDTHKNSPGANDNGSGVAGLLELARHFSRQQPARTIRFVAFTNEETPFTRTSEMGSRVYAKACRERQDNVVGM